MSNSSFRQWVHSPAPKSFGRYPDATFDSVVSMFGVMFAPRPERVVNELKRVTKPGGFIALANWTPRGFIGKMFEVFRRHVTSPTGLPSPLQWGDEDIVSERLSEGFGELHLTRRIAHLHYPFDPAGTVEFFRQYYGPTQRAFDSLASEAQALLRAELEQLQSQHNVSIQTGQTDTPSEYLEIRARRSIDDGNIQLSRKYQLKLRMNTDRHGLNRQKTGGVYPCLYPGLIHQPLAYRQQWGRPRRRTLSTPRAS